MNNLDYETPTIKIRVPRFLRTHRWIVDIAEIGAGIILFAWLLTSN